MSQCFRVLVCSIMISVCSLSQTRRTAPSGYSNVPFDASVEKLPALYRGADPVALSNALVQRRKRSAKGEFETSERYRQRIQREEGTPLLGQITLNSVLAFEVPDLETSFDADAQTLLAVISLGHSIRSRSTRRSSYGSRWHEFANFWRLLTERINRVY